MKRKLIMLLIIVLAILIFIPIAIDWLIVGNNIPSNISNSDWVGFLGGYIGALIGAATSLGGIVITIRYTNQENKKDRELQVRPYCSLRYVRTDRITYSQKNLGSYMISFEPEENNGPCINGVLYIKNIGLGPAIDFKIVIEPSKIERSCIPVMFAQTPEVMNSRVSLLQPGEEASFTIHINQNFDLISKEDIESCTDLEGNVTYLPVMKVWEKYEKFTLLITIMYRDMYENIYSQKICFKTNNYVQCNAEGGKYGSDINVEYITEPQKEKADLQ